MAINPVIIRERKPKSISSFLAGFKSTTNTAVDNAIDPGLDLYPHLGKFNRTNPYWLPNYHDQLFGIPNRLNEFQI